MIRGAAAALAALIVAGCGGSSLPQAGAEAGGSVSIASRYAPRYSPLPPRRGIAPVDIVMPGGMICGDPRLLGRPIGRIRGTNPSCGIENPVSVTSVAGVALPRAARVNCETAIAFADWTDQVAKPSARQVLSTELKSMQVAASYACRTRNHQRGARISEHARGNAIDISAFSFTNDRSVTLLEGWRGASGERSYLRSVWQGACGPFGTVLGPESDRFHQDHFHFDIARHRGGPFCR
ncbi:MAG: extensin family protein [Pseudomonadota bacterium]